MGGNTTGHKKLSEKFYFFSLLFFFFWMMKTGVVCPTRAPIYPFLLLYLSSYQSVSPLRSVYLWIYPLRLWLVAHVLWELLSFACDVTLRSLALSLACCFLWDVQRDIRGEFSFAAFNPTYHIDRKASSRRKRNLSESKSEKYLNTFSFRSSQTRTIFFNNRYITIFLSSLYSCIRFVYKKKKNI